MLGFTPPTPARSDKLENVLEGMGEAPLAQHLRHVRGLPSGQARACGRMALECCLPGLFPCDALTFPIG